MSRIDLNDAGAVVIVGSGAGGGTLAYELCRQGIRCVLLEAGPRYEINDFEQDEFAMIGKIIGRMPVEVTSQPPAQDSRPYVCRAVGGTTLHWTAVALRLHSYEMRARTTYGPVAGAALADWPVTPEELEPYYARAEDKMGVTGTHGIPLLPGNNNFRVLYEGARRIGYRNVDTGRLAINSRARDGRPGCLQMGFCMQGCRIAAKWSTLYTEIPRAESTGRLDLRASATALEIQHDPRGRASGVLYVDATGRRRLQKARVVCVAANAVESARLLLNSHSTLFPHGLGNSSGHVGRHYMTHAHAFVMGRMPRPVHFYRGTVQAGLVQDERRHDTVRGFASGYQLQQISFGLPLATLGIVPGDWGTDLAEFMGGYSHLAGLVILGEDLPKPDNRVTLSTRLVDAHGMPAASIYRDSHANDRAIIEHARRQAAALYSAVGAERIFHSEPSGLTHNMGTLRMSARPDDGVVNAFGRTHDLPNLFVSDGSQFPTSGAANPTLTIVALAIRQAEYIRRQLVARAL